jgi:hypothetical protein
MTHKIKFDWDHRLGYQLALIKKILKNVKVNDTLDFSELKFCPPLLSVFFACFIEKYPVYTINCDSYNYLSTIQFPSGFKPDLEDNWEFRLKQYRNKNYLPLINFNTLPFETEVINRNNVFSHANTIIKNIAKLPTNYYSGISYLISELSDNVIDHAEIKRGWLSFQYYPTRQYIDFCIGDTGIGLLGSYKT